MPKYQNMGAERRALVGLARMVGMSEESILRRLITGVAGRSR